MVKNVPRPPAAFDFPIAQRQQQQQFFKSLVDRFLPRDDVDLYDADIVAVCTLLLFSRDLYIALPSHLVPEHPSELFGQLIESLFITHAECKLNEIGHLVNEHVNRNRSPRGSWCANLTRRP